MYEKRIDLARKIVATVFGICGAGYVLSCHRIEWFEGVLGRDAGFWWWGEAVFGIGLHVLLAATFGLVIEALFRWWKKAPLTRKDVAITVVFAIITYLLFIGGLYSMADHSKGGPPRADSKADAT